MLATFIVTNTGDLTPSGQPVADSLRAAIIAANNNGTPNPAGAPDRIEFRIGSGQATITPTAALPAIQVAVIIDGTTQPGFVGAPLIALNGSLAGPSAGLRISAGNSTVRSLAIGGFGSGGIQLDSSGNTIAGNFIGTDLTGSNPQPNGIAGITINGSSNLVGGPAPLDLNVISGNLGDGILISSAGSNGNQIRNNYIGTNLSGRGAVPNSRDGIHIVDIVDGNTSNQIGGGNTGDANTISGNGNDGIFISSASGVAVTGNFIGTDPTGLIAVPNQGSGIELISTTSIGIGGTTRDSGNVISGNLGDGVTLRNVTTTRIYNNIIGAGLDRTTDLGNARAGVRVSGATGTAIGGTGPLQPNTIAFNGSAGLQPGVAIISGSGIPILSNSIFSNAGPGIDLGDDGPTPNDLGDSDLGPNNLQNSPVLRKIETAAGRTLIQGSLNSEPNKTYLIQFFVNPNPSPSTFVQGKTYPPNQVGAQYDAPVLVTTDADGNATINLILSDPVQVGQFVTATATEMVNLVPAGTSEFSEPATVARGSPADLAVAITATSEPASVGSPLVYTITAFNGGPSAATNVVLDATLPMAVTTDLAGTSQGMCTLSGNAFEAHFGTIAARQTATATITVTPNSFGSVTITSSVLGDQIDPDTSNNTARHSTMVNVPIDLSIQVTPDPNPVAANGTLTFTILVTNNINDPNAGPASGVVVTNTLPAGTTFLSASNGQGTFNQPVNGVLTLSLGTLAPGATAASTITVAVGPTTGTVANVATVSADQTDANPSNNTVSTDIEVKPSADLAVSMTASPNPVLAGHQLVYIVTVSNTGPANAGGVVLTNTLPAGATVDSIVPSQRNATPAGDQITADFGTILAGGTATLTIVVRPGGSGTITNTATVTSGELDPDLSNNTASVSTVVSPADVGVTIVAAPTPAVPGTNLVYTIVVTNFGPAGATGVHLVNQLPRGIRFVSATSDQGTPSLAGGVVTTDIGAMAAGSRVAVRVTVVPLTSTILTTTAAVKSNETDNNPANNTASLQTLVGPADLTVLAASSPTSVLVGDQLNFVVTVVNHGPAAASGVVLTNTLPAGVVFVSALGPDFSAIGSPVNGVLTATTRVALAPGASATLVVTVRPTAVGAAVNTAHVVSSSLDPNPTDNTATALANVTNQPGTLQFASPVFEVDEGAGMASITVTRTAGNQGAVTIPYLASGGTAVPGLDYTPVSGLLVFNDGETVKTFTVPIIDNTITQPDRTVILTLGAPSDGAALGPLANAALIIHDNDPDLSGPVATDLQLLGGVRVTGVVLSFNEPLNPAKASDPRNYALIATNQRLRGGGRGDAAAPIVSVLYDPISNRVLLTPAHPLQANQIYRVAANAGPGGLTDLAGNPLDGSGNGVNGTNLELTFARGTNLVYGDGNGDAVNLRLSDGGFLSLIRAANGDALMLSVLGNVKRRSTLSGSVRPTRAGGDAVTTIGRIDGLDPFGRIRSTLRTPPFIVGNQPLVASSVIRPAAVDALLASGSLVNNRTPLNRSRFIYNDI